MASKMPASKKVAEIDYTFLQCAICFEKFTRPKVLKCLHSYCEPCLERTPQPEGWITCPECRHKTRVPRGGVAYLKDNFLMNGLMDNARVRSQLMMTKTQQKTVMCNCCKKEKQAEARCLDCNRYLCKSCKTAHLGLDALRHHQVASLDELRSGKVTARSATPRTQPTCPRHPDRKAEVYCLTCEELICKDCKPAGSKTSKHQHVDPQQAARQKKIELQKRVPALARVCETLLVAERQDTETKHSIEARAQLVQAQLDEAATAMHSKIDQEKRRILQEVNDIKSARLRALQDHKNRTSYMRKQAQNAYDVTKNAITQARATAFLSIYPSLDSKIQDLCSGKVKPRRIDHNPKPFAFVPSNTIDDLQLGMVVEECTEFPASFKSACGIAACPNGDIVVADHDMDSVAIFGGSGECKLTLQPPSPSDGIHNVTDVAVTSIGQLLLVDKSHNVRIFSKEGKFLRNISTPKVSDKPDPIGRPRSVAVYQKGGKEYMVVGYHGVCFLTIHHLAAGSVITKLSPTIRPGCLSMTNDNHILVSDYDAGRVVVLSISGQSLVSIDTTTQGSRLRASGVCTDAYGNIYVAVHYPDKGTAQIRRYNAAGKFLSCVAEGLQNPQNIAFTKHATPKLVVADEDTVKLFKIN